MAYIILANIIDDIPRPHLIEALDDNQDGQSDPDVVTALLEEASREADAILSKSYKTPFASPVPPAVREAARIFAKEKVYKRRGVNGKDNPFAADAKEWRDRLQEIADGKAKLHPDKKPKATAAAVTSDSKTHSSAGKTAV